MEVGASWPPTTLDKVRGSGDGVSRMWMHLRLSYSTPMYCMVVNVAVKGCFVNKPSRRHLDWHELERKSASSTLTIEGPCLLVSICVSWSFMLPRVTWNYNDVLTYFLSLKISLSGGRFSSRSGCSIRASINGFMSV
jgi:hypothetical protein